MIEPGRNVKKGFGKRRPAVERTFDHHLPYRLRSFGPSGFPCGNDINTTSSQRLAQSLRLGRLATAFSPFEGDQAATLRVLDGQLGPQIR